MTREDFIKKVGLSPEEYEELNIKYDLTGYYDFKIMIDYACVIVKEKIITAPFFTKRKLKEISEVLEKYQEYYNDKNIEFNFIKGIANGDLNILLERLGDNEERQRKYSSAIARLMLYCDYSNKSIEEILEYFSEPRYIIQLENVNPEKFNLFFELHPEINKEEYLTKYSKNSENAK